MAQRGWLASVALVAVALLLAPACGGGGGSSAPLLAPPTVEVTEPAVDRLIATLPAETVEIRFTDMDPTGTALIDVIADRDGSPATTTDQVVIAQDLLPQNGTEHVLTWLAETVAPGTYGIYARVRFGSDLEVVGVAPGRIQVDALPIEDA